MIPRRGNYDRPFRRGNWRTGTRKRELEDKIQKERSMLEFLLDEERNNRWKNRFPRIVIFHRFVVARKLVGRETLWLTSLDDINLIFILGADWRVESSRLVELNYWGREGGWVRRGFRFCISVVYTSLWNFQLSSLVWNNDRISSYLFIQRYFIQFAFIFFHHFSKFEEFLSLEDHRAC